MSSDRLTDLLVVLRQAKSEDDSDSAVEALIGRWDHEDTAPDRERAAMLSGSIEAARTELAGCEALLSAGRISPRQFEKTSIRLQKRIARLQRRQAASPYALRDYRAGLIRRRDPR